MIEDVAWLAAVCLWIYINWAGSECCDTCDWIHSVLLTHAARPRILTVSCCFCLRAPATLGEANVHPLFACQIWLCDGNLKRRDRMALAFFERLMRLTYVVVIIYRFRKFPQVVIDVSVETYLEIEIGQGTTAQRWKVHCLASLVTEASDCF